MNTTFIKDPIFINSLYSDTTGSIREYTSATVELADDTINVNADVIGFLNMMDNAMYGIFGSLYYYDPLNEVICTQIMKVVSGDYSLPLAIQEGGVSRASPEEVVMDITTIITKDEFGNAMIHQRVDIPIQMLNTGRTIYLQCVDNCGLNMDSVQIYFNHFYSLLGTYETEELVYNYETNKLEYKKVDLIPEIVVYNGKLNLATIKEGVVVLFGEASKIVDRIQDPDWYREISGSWGYSQGGYEASILNLISTKQLLGKGQSHLPQRFALIKSDVIFDYFEHWKANSGLHFAGFLALHETGHTAGIRDWTGNRFCQSYMSSGRCILTGYLGHTPISCPEGGCYLGFGGPFNDLESFVQTTMAHIKYLWIKELIYKRFIK